MDRPQKQPIPHQFSNRHPHSRVQDIRQSRLWALRSARLLSAFRRESGGAAPEAVRPARIEPNRGRFWVVAGCFGVFVGLILLRLFSYQIVRWGDVVQAAAYNPGEHVARGVIVDRTGNLYAADRFFFQISAEPRQIKSHEERMEIARILNDLVGFSAEETFRQLTEYATLAYLPLGDLINQQDGRQLLDWKEQNEEDENPLEYVTIRPAPRRYYPQHELASHILGFVNTESVRRPNYGLEKYYDRFLRQDGVGLTGRSWEALDTLPSAVRQFVPSAAGKDLILTIDRGVQWVIEEELRAGVEFYRAEAGTIIVMEPKSGAILGMANWPTYDPNRYSETDFNNFINTSISAQYEPGSIFKVITMAAALDLDVLEPSTIYTDTGVIVIGGRTIQNSDRLATGPVSATEALARSLNVVSAEIASQIGATEFYRYIRRFGFGEATEIDLAGEVAGLLKEPGNPEWSVSDLGTNSFGQGLAVTPIQMINAVAAIANHGTLMRPYVVQARVYNDHVQVTQPTIVRQVVTPQTAAQLSEMMVDVVYTGNHAAIVPNYVVAGKSGTAEIPTEEGYTLDETIVSFVGFAPWDNPRFVLLVTLDRPDPAISRWANATAAPVFSRTALRLLSLMDVPPVEN